MSYSVKFEAASNKIIRKCKEYVRDEWGPTFDTWTGIDAGLNFGHLFQDSFVEQFGDFLTEQQKSDLFLAGSHIMYAIRAYKRINPQTTCTRIVKFTEQFVTEQLEDFGNWCEIQGEGLYEDEYTEDNPI
jgi:hypothetical protein